MYILLYNSCGLLSKLDETAVDFSVIWNKWKWRLAFYIFTVGIINIHCMQQVTAANTEQSTARSYPSQIMIKFYC